MEQAQVTTEKQEPSTFPMQVGRVVQKKKKDTNISQLNAHAKLEKEHPSP
jgi:hypothetical protein